MDLLMINTSTFLNPGFILRIEVLCFISVIAILIGYVTVMRGDQ